MIKEEARNMLTGGLPGMGFVRSAIRTGKSERQQERDAIRADQKQAGIVDDNYQLELGSSKYNLGLDGGARRDNGKRIFEVDMDDKRSERAIANVDWLGHLMSQGKSDNAKVSTSGGYANAVLDSGMDIDQASKLLAEKHGIKNKKDAFDAVNKMETSKGIDSSLANIYRNSINNLYGR
jgi:hypothetical protein